jgi:hypothetical protein
MIFKSPMMNKIRKKDQHAFAGEIITHLYGFIAPVSLSVQGYLGFEFLPARRDMGSR